MPSCKAGWGEIQGSISQAPHQNRLLWVGGMGRAAPVVLQTRPLLWLVNYGKEISGKIFRVWLAQAPRSGRLLVDNCKCRCMLSPTTRNISFLAHGINLYRASTLFARCCCYFKP